MPFQLMWHVLNVWNVFKGIQSTPAPDVRQSINCHRWCPAEKRISFNCHLNSSKQRAAKTFCCTSNRDNHNHNIIESRHLCKMIIIFKSIEKSMSLNRFQCDTIALYWINKFSPSINSFFTSSLIFLLNSRTFSIDF